METASGYIDGCQNPNYDWFPAPEYDTGEDDGVNNGEFMDPIN
ncbi:MAG: hypothetical protein ACK5HR_07410 [Mycoplasmatales bacterium]